MGKLNVIKIDTHPRGDSGLLRWSIVRRQADGSTAPMSLAGYKVALTVKEKQWDNAPDDMEGSETARGYEGQLWMTTIDCDNSVEMHGIKPEEGKVLFEFPKQTNWVEPGTYWMDIVIENKASRRTTTVFLGQLEVQGHPTNRLTTDAPDTFDDIRG